MNLRPSPRIPRRFKNSSCSDHHTSVEVGSPRGHSARAKCVPTVENAACGASLQRKGESQTEVSSMSIMQQLRQALRHDCRTERCIASDLEIPQPNLNRLSNGKGGLTLVWIDSLAAYLNLELCPIHKRANKNGRSRSGAGLVIIVGSGTKNGGRPRQKPRSGGNWRTGPRPEK